MYAWGVDDANTWKKPGYKFEDANAPYLNKLAEEAKKKGERTYTVGKMPKMDAVSPKGKDLESMSKNPVILVVDGTQSMQKWPFEIFDRVPLFFQTLVQYQPDLEAAIYVVGDAKWDNWPLQVNKFGRGLELEEMLKAVKAEGGGGPGIRESYELAAYFIDRHVKTPNAKSPTIIVMGDEKFYEQVDTAQVEKHIGDKLVQPVGSMQLWKALAQKYDIYMLRKQYEPHDTEIEGQWVEALGKQKVLPVYDPNRVVDIAMGLMAEKWGKFTNFKQNLAARQDSKGIKSVMDSLKAAPKVDYSSKSVTGLASATGAAKVAKSIKLAPVPKAGDAA